MDKQALYKVWKEEENQAHIKGWDFSHIHHRYKEENDLPWDFKAIIHNYLKKDRKLLDMETGGGEFLLSFNHPYNNTSAIEGYKPNVEYCKEVLVPLGIDFKEADGEEVLPFAKDSFDLITNRHGAYNIAELTRVLKKDGLFITQQVGAENDKELIHLLQPELTTFAYSNLYLDVQKQEFIKHGFEIIECGETFRPIYFYDVGALVWFARIIEWEFPGFSVDTHLENLYKAQVMIEKHGFIEGSIHRFYIVAKKK